MTDQPVVRVLQQNLINQIAAGEVIERPAAAIKELVENALDAKATEIQVTLREGGRAFIQVTDNGHGMTQENLLLAVQRHATSKLPTEDLFNINSFGFRGEALPSIGSVSRLTLTTKIASAETGWTLSIEGGVQQALTPTVATCGTSVTVRDLFYATPARLKFLKSEQTELTQCVDLLQKVALAHPSVGFSLKNNERIVFNYPAQQTQEARIAAVLKDIFIENAQEFSYTAQGITISGYLSLPTYNRSQSNDQYVFVNQRPVKDKLFHMALRLAYQDFIPSNRHPVAVVFIALSPDEVDVNAHPAKTEVRFRDAQLIRTSLLSAFKKTITGMAQKTSSHLAHETVAMFQKPVTVQDMNFERSLNQQAYAARHSTGGGGHFSAQTTQSTSARVTPFVLPQAPTPILPISEKGPLGSARAQIHDTYIISETEESLIIVDQHAAHERLTYEKLKISFEQGTINSQTLLIPEVIQLSEEGIELLREHDQNLRRLGFSYELFAPSTVVVRSLPALLKNVQVGSLFQDLVDDLKTLDTPNSFITEILHIFATLACHTSIRAGRSLSHPEMNALLRQMEQTPHAGQCNHGRPTYITLKRSDIEKLFERR